MENYRYRGRGGELGYRKTWKIMVEKINRLLSRTRIKKRMESLGLRKVQALM